MKIENITVSCSTPGNEYAISIQIKPDFDLENDKEKAVKWYEFMSKLGDNLKTKTSGLVSIYDTASPVTKILHILGVGEDEYENRVIKNVIHASIKPIFENIEYAIMNGRRTPAVKTISSKILIVIHDKLNIKTEYKDGTTTDVPNDEQTSSTGIIPKDVLIEIFKDFLKDKIINVEKNGGYWSYGFGAGLLDFYLNCSSSAAGLNIGSHLRYEDDKFIGYDIYNTYSAYQDYVNIIIRKDSIDFIEDSVFDDFSKDEMRKLYEMIRSVKFGENPIDGTSFIEYDHSTRNHNIDSYATAKYSRNWDYDCEDCDDDGDGDCEDCDYYEEEEYDIPPVPTISVEFEIPEDYPDELIKSIGDITYNMLRGSGDYRNDNIILNNDNGIHLVVGTDDCEDINLGIKAAKFIMSTFCDSIKLMGSGSDTYHNIVTETADKQTSESKEEETKTEDTGYIKVDAPMKEFESGAKRTDKTGKGMSSLIPWKVVGVVLHNIHDILSNNGSDTQLIYEAFSKISVDLPYEIECYNTNKNDPDEDWERDACDCIYTIGQTIVYVMLSAYSTDYVYTGKNGDITIDADPDIFYSALASALQDLSVHYELGAKIHGVDNWKKGIPNESFYNSATRHFYQFMKGMTDEKHDVACLWNLFGLMWNFLQEIDYDI